MGNPQGQSVAVHGRGEGGRDWFANGDSLFWESKFPWGGGDRKFLELGSGLHNVYLEVIGLRLYASISIKNKNKYKQQISGQPRGPFQDGFWG